MKIGIGVAESLRMAFAWVSQGLGLRSPGTNLNRRGGLIPSKRPAEGSTKTDQDRISWNRIKSQSASSNQKQDPALGLTEAMSCLGLPSKMRLSVRKSAFVDTKKSVL